MRMLEQSRCLNFLVHPQQNVHPSAIVFAALTLQSIRCRVVGKPEGVTNPALQALVGLQ